MKLSELVDTVEVPQTQVADTAWDSGVRRVRRRRAGIVVGAAVLTAGVVATASLAGDGDRDGAPAPPAKSPSTANPSPSQEPTVTAAMKMPGLYTDAAWERIADPAAHGSSRRPRTRWTSQRTLSTTPCWRSAIPKTRLGSSSSERTGSGDGSTAWTWSR